MVTLIIKSRDGFLSPLFCCAATACGYNESLHKRLYITLYLELYRKTPIISPELIFVQKAFLVGFFQGGGIIGGSFVLQKLFGLYLERILHLKMRDFASEIMCQKE